MAPPPLCQWRGPCAALEGGTCLTIPAAFCMAPACDHMCGFHDGYDLYSFTTVAGGCTNGEAQRPTAARDEQDPPPNIHPGSRN